MKRQIRNGVFETNSSATHAITIYFSDKFSGYTISDPFVVELGKLTLQEK